MRVILHIGSTKTGSSALQLMLFERRAELLKAGVLYSERGVVASAHHLIAAAVHHGAWRMHPELPPDRDAYFREAAAAIRAEATARGADTVVISSEYFWGSLRPSAYLAVREAFGPGPFEVVAFVRRPDEWAMSSYLQAVKSGETKPFAAWFNAVLARPDSGLNYFRVIHRWARTLEARKVHVIRYADAQDNVLSAFTRATGIDIASGGAVRRANPSPSAAGLDLLLAINRSDLAPGEKSAERAAVMRQHRSDTPTRALMSEDERARIFAVAGRTEGLLRRFYLPGCEPLFGGSDVPQALAS